MKNAKQVNVNSSNFDRYIGYGVFEFTAINPNKAELEKIGINVENEPVYHTVKDNINESIIDVYMKHISNDESPFEFPLRVRFFLRGKTIYSTDKKSLKVINNYGEAAFIPIENYKENSVPSSQAWFCGPYKASFEGQEEFTKFLAAYFGIPTRSYVDKTGTRKTIENLQDAEVGLDDWSKILKGDFSELNIFKQFTNRVRLLVGVKTVDNKTYQDIFMQCFIKINNTRTDYLATCLEKAKNAGRYSSTEFEIGPIRKYALNSTPTVVKEVTTQMPTLEEPIDTENASTTETTVDTYLESSVDDLPF